MNVEEYIATGNLEAYALGVSTPAQKAEVEAMLVAFPMLREELAQIEESLLQYAEANAIAPSAGTRARVLEAISSTKKEAPVIPITSSKKINWLAAASITLLIASAAGNYILYNRYQYSYSRVLVLENEKSVLAEDLNASKAKYTESSGMLAMINNPATRLVEMKGTPVSPGSKAMIYWDTASADVYVSVASLPEPPAGMQYQLWAIVDGAPVDAGMITMDDDPYMPHRMKRFETAQAFAVTLEKAGGSPVPTMEAMYVMGAVPA